MTSPYGEERLDERWNQAISLFRQGDKSGALFLFRALAIDGEKAAFREVANIYEQGGGGVERDIKKAQEWYQKAIDTANDAYGCLGLARIHYYGKTGVHDYEKAFDYLKIIEDNNIPSANIMLGRMYGLGKGVERDYSKAKKYFILAVENGNLIALKDFALLELEEGHFLKGLRIWLTAMVKIIVTSLRNPKDQRLKRV